MFTIEMLPANEGDALWIEYGSNPVRRILVDCGRKRAYEEIARRLADITDPLELFVLTHVDADHITGGVPLLQDERFGRQKVRDVWFNGWLHLNGRHWDQPGVPVLGAQQGEYFSALLKDRRYPWNEKFAGMPAMISDDRPLPRFELGGGMVLTVLGPTMEKLTDMRDRWERDLAAVDPDKQIPPGDYERALEVLGDDPRSGPAVLGHQAPSGPIDVPKLLDLPFKTDKSEPNGSTISFLAEYDGQALLLAGDAHAPQLAASLRRLLAERGLQRLPVTAVKLSHHGSASNTSIELLELLDCSRYLVSTDGTRHNHPDPPALARILDVHRGGVEFHFNYCSGEALLWNVDALRSDYRFKTFYPASGAGLKVTL